MAFNEQQIGCKPMLPLLLLPKVDKAQRWKKWKRGDAGGCVWMEEEEKRRFWCLRWRWRRHLVAEARTNAPHPNPIEASLGCALCDVLCVSGWRWFGRIMCVARFPWHTFLQAACIVTWSPSTLGNKAVKGSGAERDKTTASWSWSWGERQRKLLGSVVWHVRKSDEAGLGNWGPMRDSLRNNSRD